jgi:hypothetical protein
MGFRLWSGTGTDENQASYTGAAIPLDGSATLTTTWQRFTVTGTVATSATEIAVQIYGTPTGTAGAADFFEVTGVQLDVGSVALPYRTNAGTFQGELAACQRYYYRTVADSNYTQFGNGSSKQTNSAQIMIPFPVTMRTAPSALTYGSLVLFDGSTIINAGTVTLNYCGRSVGAVDCLTASVQTQFRSYFMLSDNTTAGFIAFSAEL